MCEAVKLNSNRFQVYFVKNLFKGSVQVQLRQAKETVKRRIRRVAIGLHEAFKQRRQRILVVGRRRECLGVASRPNLHGNVVQDQPGAAQPLHGPL